MQKQFSFNHPVSHTEANGNQSPPQPKDSLSFSRDKNSEDFKSNWAIGKIKHQIKIAANDDFSSKG